MPKLAASPNVQLHVANIDNWWATSTPVVAQHIRADIAEGRDEYRDELDLARQLNPVPALLGEVAVMGVQGAFILIFKAIGIASDSDGVLVGYGDALKKRLQVREQARINLQTFTRATRPAFRKAGRILKTHRQQQAQPN